METYAEYLKSKDWQKKRRNKLRHDPHRCAVCGSPHRLQVHHLVYRNNLKLTKQKELKILCDDCHRIAHDLIAAGELKYSKKFNRLKVAVMAFISARQLDDELRRCHFTGQLDGSGIDDLNVGYGERPKAG